MNEWKMVEKMLLWATNAHAGQLDPGGTPYILHPLKVMHFLQTEDEELMCIALGHDLIEDTFVTADHLRSWGFSERVVSGIVALTKHEGQTYEEYKAAVFSNPDAMRVKMADLKHNTDISRLKNVTQKDADRMVRYYQFYLEIKSRLQ
jgi:(p)ppGpp synthase/HD superfamily hydrolase